MKLSNVMKWRFRDAHFNQKLTVLSMVSSLVALALTGSALIALDLAGQRRMIVENLSILSEVVGSNSSAAILFDDPEAAHETLTGLNAQTEILAAAIYDKSGRSFATYSRTNAKELPPHLAPTYGLKNRGDFLTLSAPIVFQNDHIGSIFFLYNLTKLEDRLLTDLAVVGIVLILSFLVSLFLASKLKKITSKPILHLAEIARQITVQNNYALRATKQSNDELGKLTEDFNIMLGEVQRRDQRAEEAIRVRDEFISIASHELKTPLTTLQLQVQTVLLRAIKGELANLSPEKLLKIQDVTRRQMEKFSHLIDELLDVTRLSTYKVKLEFEELDLIELVKQVIEDLSHELQRARCPIHLEAPQSLIGEWDRLRIEQVVSNLLTNASKYGAGMPIHVTVSQSNDWVRVSVQDFGIGISKVDQLRIFERFERAVSIRHFGGFGLGLFIAQQNIATHGGNIWVESELGKGSCFVFEIPLRPVASNKEAA